MDYEEFVRWTEELVELGRLTPEQALDLQRQRARFDEERDWLEREYEGRVAGFADDRLFVADRTGALLDEIEETFALERQVYFEPIPAAGEW